MSDFRPSSSNRCMWLSPQVLRLLQNMTHLLFSFPDFLHAQQSLLLADVQSLSLQSQQAPELCRCFCLILYLDVLLPILLSRLHLSPAVFLPLTFLSCQRLPPRFCLSVPSLFLPCILLH